MFYIDVAASDGSVISKPHPTQETAIFTISGTIDVNGDRFGPGEFILLDGNDHDITMLESGRFIMLGGERFEKVPHLHWNFLSFSKERIDQANQDWRYGRFPTIPGDDKEYIPH